MLIDLLHQYNLSADGTDVIFVCKDGYAPVRHASEMTKLSGGYIVYKDMEAKDGRNWPDSLYNSYSPFYLVWNVDLSKTKELPWPYGLVQIRLVERDSSLLNALSGKSTILKGYHLFRRHCLSCHSMNKIGGKVGPEMNVPKNITEYWTDDHIAHYIKAPKSFRYNAHMPAMKDISDEEIDQIVKYLHFMKKYKIP
ncbi:c-type cytochrome [Niabella ginsengisoli]|uniref:Cytochrome c n=1 Tax=Niabella ginsengisoli TaxID=522298 RepID=A0ABS9SG34_9BACT|nr:cytochrome c [Niabella ginsengisoli]MCH5597320.1 cytochrome c [Niabella ginsengisoli]